MNETPMLFPVEPSVFWKQMKTIVEEVVSEKLRSPTPTRQTDLLSQKLLLKPAEVCAIFQISKPTLYGWMKEQKLHSFKVNSRRYFKFEDVEMLIRQQNTSSDRVNK